MTYVQEDNHEVNNDIIPTYGNAIQDSLEPNALPIRDLDHVMCGSGDPLDVQVLNNETVFEAEGKALKIPTAEHYASDTSRIGTPTTELSDLDEQELRCVIAIVRHGDRTPKQKLKVVTSEPFILEYFSTHSSSLRKELKVKERKPMIQFLECVITMIAFKEEAGGKLREKEPFSAEKFDEVKGGEMSLYTLYHLRDVLERWKIVGLNRKLQIKPRAWAESVNPDTGEFSLSCTEVQLILKWGGNLTKLGEKQAVSLGERFRYQMYPDTPGGGILRLHSTFRHDLKIKTSDEGRVMKTAAAFAKGLLELEGDIAPILVSL
jgi:inositol hexakisphosphate/diphosphoinositol-pentakisphosphate kinase